MRYLAFGLLLVSFASAACADETAEMAAKVEALEDGGTLVLEKRTYRLRPAGAKKMFLAPSNNQTGEKNVVFPIVGKRNVTIDGNGATLVIDGSCTPFAVLRSKGVTVRNLVLTKPDPIIAELAVREKRRDGVVFAFRGNVPYRVRDGELSISCDGGEVSSRNGRISLHLLDHTKVHFLMTASGLKAEPDVTGLPAGLSQVVFEDLGDRAVLARYLNAERDSGCSHPIPYDVGAAVGINLYARQDIGLFLEDAEDCLVENVTIRRFGGMGLVAQRCGDIRVDGFRTRTQEGDRTSTAADMMQFVSCWGKVTVENCEGGDTMDDIINVHGNYLAVDGWDGDRLVLRNFLNSNKPTSDDHYGFFPVREGDVLSFLEKPSRKETWRGTVERVFADPGDPLRLKVTFKDGERIPRRGQLVENLTLYPEVVFRNNTFRHFPNLRFSGRGKCLIEGNRLEDFNYIVVVDLMHLWHECGPVSDMTIRNNSFVKRNGRNGTFVYISSDGWDVDKVVHGRIVVENNRYESDRDLNRAIVWGSVADFVMRDEVGTVFEKPRPRASTEPAPVGSTDVVELSVSPQSELSDPVAAVDRIRQWRRSGRLGPDETACVRIAAGVYELPRELVIDSEVSPVSFVGAGAGSTVLSGGRRLEPFVVGQDGVWRARVPSGFTFEQLWVNGTRAQCAKAPNRFFYYVRNAVEGDPDPKSKEKVTPSRREFVGDVEAARLLSAISADEMTNAVVHVWWAWSDEWLRPVRADGATGMISLNHDVTHDFFKWKDWCPRFTVENCRSALDAPGEWFLDRKRSELLYLPRKGETPEQTVAIAPKLERIVRVRRGAKDVSFSGIAFAHNAWKFGEWVYPHQSALYGVDAAIEVTDAERVSFSNCRVEHTADYGLWLGEGVADSSVRHTWFEDLGAGGVRIGARQWNVKIPPSKVARRITIDDNVVFSGGHVFPSGSGVFVTYATDCRVTHNEICDLYYSGISCGWRWGFDPTPNRNHEISWNHIHHLGKGVLSDMGAIYTLGDNRGTVICGNHGGHVWSYDRTGCGGTGLYADQGSGGILWTSNLIHHTKTAAVNVNYGRDNVFRNNICAFTEKPDAALVGRWTPESNESMVCSNNVFVYSSQGRAVLCWWRKKPGAVNDLVFGSNLWWTPGGTKTNDFNRQSLSVWRQQGKDVDSVFEDPGFVDAAHGDWRLKPGSPAFKIGFREWDYTLAGVRKDDPEWRAKAAAIRPAAFEVPPEPPRNEGQIVPTKPRKDKDQRR